MLEAVAVRKCKRRVRNKGVELKARSTFNSNSAFDADFTELNFGKP